MFSGCFLSPIYSRGPERLEISLSTLRYTSFLPHCVTRFWVCWNVVFKKSLFLSYRMIYVIIIHLSVFIIHLALVPSGASGTFYMQPSEASQVLRASFKKKTRGTWGFHTKTQCAWHLIGQLQQSSHFIVLRMIIWNWLLLFVVWAAR